MLLLQNYDFNLLDSYRYSMPLNKILMRNQNLFSFRTLKLVSYKQMLHNKNYCHTFIFKVLKHQNISFLLLHAFHFLCTLTPITEDRKFSYHLLLVGFKWALVIHLLFLFQFLFNCYNQFILNQCLLMRLYYLKKSFGYSLSFL